MSLVALDGTPLVLLGAPMRGGVASATPLSSTLLDAAGEACIMVGRIFTEDGASHTIDTSGSSALEWQTGAVTFANAGTTVVVGLAAVDAATGPPVRAVNVANVITFDVSRSHTGGGITAIGWQTNVPTSGTKTIANGDLVAFCVQMTARGGTTDLVNVSTAAAGSAQLRPTVTNYIGAAYNDAARLPNAVITFSDGARGWFWGGYVTSSATNRAFNNTATREYGNLLQFPFPVRAYGITASVIASGNLDLKLYTDPLGTPVDQRSCSVDMNTVAAGGTFGLLVEYFPFTYDIAPNTPIVVAVTPTSATNVTMAHLTMNAAAHQKTMHNGINGYAVNRSTGAFAVQNANKDRFGIGLLVGAFEHGVPPTYAMGI